MTRYRLTLQAIDPDSTDEDLLTRVEFDSDTPDHLMADRTLTVVDPGTDYDQTVTARVRRARQLDAAAFAWERHGKISGARS